MPQSAQCPACPCFQFSRVSACGVSVLSSLLRARDAEPRRGGAASQQPPRVGSVPSFPSICSRGSKFPACEDLIEDTL